MTGGFSASPRALHWVFKIARREETIAFYRDFLGMKILRHEEFDEGCEAACNGPYGNKWSKTMIGYGPESDHFVLELTYNYGIKKYICGNDFQSITLAHNEALKAIQSGSGPAAQDGTKYKTGTDGKDHFIVSPNGYKFYIVPEEGNLKQNGHRFVKVSIGVSDLQKSIDYWNGALGMEVLNKESDKGLLSYGKQQTPLELINQGAKIERKTAYGRIAFACPAKDLKPLEAKMKEGGQTILTPYVELPTPGKATVCVVILADPDGQEICFVGQEAFDELSQVDPNGGKLLEEAIKNDPTLKPSK